MSHTPPKGLWSARAIPGATFALHVTPGARRKALYDDGGTLRCTTTAEPDGGRANADVAEQLAHALGVAKSRLTLVRGATSREKLFRLDQTAD